jgi:type I restriction enzyme S subunit
MTQLPPGWVPATVGDLLANVDAGKSLSGFGRPAGPGELGVIKVSAMTWGTFRPEENKALPPGTVIEPRWTVRAGDLLFSRANTSAYVGACVQVAETHPNLILSDKSLRLTPSPGVVSTWLMYALRAEGTRTQIEALASGTKESMRNISQEKLRSIRIPVPPTAEQERIVAAIEEAFSLLDAGETALHNTRKRLKRMRDSVLTAAVTGQLVPQEPTGTPTSDELAGGCQSVGDQSLQEVPESWSWVRLGSIASEVRNGVFASRPSAEPPGIPILRIGAVRPMALDLNDVRYADLDPGDPAVGRALLEGGDLLFTRYNGNPEFVGACAAVPASIGPLLHPDKLIRVKVDTNVALPRFVEIAATTGASRTFTRSVTKTTAGQAGISGSDLKRMPLPLPPVAEQSRIVEEVERQFSFIEAVERAVDATLSRSAGLRRSVLKAAFEGRLVEQDPADEPASVLLERIAADRAAAATRKRVPSRVWGKVVAS